MRAVSTVVGAAVISMATTSLVAHSRNFRISEVGGYFYWLVVSPIVGAFVGWVIYLALSRAVSGWKLVCGSLVITAVLGAVGHTWALDHGQIGGEYLPPKGFDPKGMSADDLLHALSDRNRETAGRAWVELQARADHDPELMWRAVQSFRAEDRVRYIDSYRTIDAVAFLAGRGDRRVVPILQEILGSQETSLITAPGGESQVVFHNRAFAKDLLSRHFGISVQVETTRPPAAESSR